MEHLPAEVPNDAIRAALGPFGTVHEITDLKYSGTSICTSTRLIKVSLASDIPVNLRILHYPCRIFYRGQRRPCAICHSPSHCTGDCPLHDVCRHCREPGHFARSCTKDLSAPGDAVNDPPTASVDDPLSESVPSSENVEEPADSVADDESASDDVPSSASILAGLLVADKDVSPSRAAKRPRSSSESASSPEEYLASHGYSKDAFMFDDGDCLAIFDMRRLTYRVLHDTATFEMYRECYYDEVPLSKRILAPSVFPCERSAPPDVIVLDPDAVPASFPASSPPFC